MEKLLIATRNGHKLEEIKTMLGQLEYEIVSLDEIDVDPQFEVEENGNTFRENAILKARGYGRKANLLTLADDSGLCVDELAGRPGVFSARYGKTVEERITKLLKELDGVPRERRTARYETVVAVYDPKNERVCTCVGKCDGYITLNIEGEGGFGFDPIFFSKDLNKTFGNASPEEKNSVSHRGRVMNEIVKLLQSFY